MGNRINNTKQKTQRIANPMSPRLLPLKKAANYIGLTVWAMRESIWAGDIPVVNFPVGGSNLSMFKTLKHLSKAIKPGFCETQFVLLDVNLWCDNNYFIDPIRI